MDGDGATLGSGLPTGDGSSPGAPPRDAAPADRGRSAKRRRLDDLDRLVTGLGAFFTQLARRVRQGATAVAGLAAAMGVVALILGEWVWHDEPAAAVLVALVCLPAIAAPLFVLKRLRPITDAVEHPDEAARQARSYFAGLQSTPELNQLVTEAAGLQRASGKVRLRGGFRSVRLISSLVESVAPDPKTQPLVAAFAPSRLRSIWLGVLTAWFFAIVAWTLAIVAAVSLIVESIA